MQRLYILVMALIFASLSSVAQTLAEADSLHQRGRELAEDGMIAEARSCDLRAMDIRKQLLGEVSEEYILSLNNYAATFMMEEDYSTAADVLEQVMDLCDRLAAPHPKLVIFANNAAYSNYILGNKDKAIAYWEMALPLVEKYSGQYEGVLSGLSLLYDETGNMEGLARVMALIEDHNLHELSLPCDEPGCMIKRAQYYAVTGDQAMARYCYAQVLAMPMDRDTQIEAYEGYAEFVYSSVRDCMTAGDYQYKGALLRKERDGANDGYVSSMLKAATLYFIAQNEGWSKALACCDSVLIAMPPGASEVQARCLKLKGNSCSALQDYAKARDCFKTAIAYYEDNDRENEEYPKLIERLAAAEKFDGDYDSSIAHYLQAMRIYEEKGMLMEYSEAESALARCYAYTGKPMPEDTGQKYGDAANEAQRMRLRQMIAEEKGDLELTRTYLGMRSYARSLGTIAGCYMLLEDYEEAVCYFGLYIDAIRNALRDEFRMQDESERMHSWQQESTNIKNIQELLVYLHESQDSVARDLASLAYDTELLSKGILLNSSIEFEKVLKDNNNPRLSEIYNRIKENMAEIDRLRHKKQNDNDMEKILALGQENRRLQLELNKGCLEMEDFTRYISYDWHDVQSALTDRDVCIEFVSASFGADDKMVALVLTKDAPAPAAVILWDDARMIDLYESEYYSAINDSLMTASLSGGDIRKSIGAFREKIRSSDSPLKTELSLYLNLLKQQADTTFGFFSPRLRLLSYADMIKGNDAMFTDDDVSSLIWRPLLPYLKDKERIFFSPDGLFNYTAIEYLPYNGKPLSEGFEVYRLSSTKELCRHHDDTPLVKAALFGDINYNGCATRSDATRSSLSALRSASGEGYFGDLENTLREVTDIQDILKSHGVEHAERFCDTDAAKQVFLDLSGSSVNLLHVATHGMYSEAEELTDAESMERSILAFAGANLDDDALVTAADIAKMDLRHCDMAVLSACETGLGKLGNDGVFGLQRGFKNAGVNTLMMSLKNVNDTSTADLMIYFYKHLLSGCDKRQALVKAQQDIRERGFSDPMYWTSFILLDATDR